MKHTLHTLPRFLFSLVMLSLVAACVLVDDFSAKWTDAKTDPCIDVIVEADYAKSFERAKTLPIARSFSIDGLNDVHFLLLKNKEEDKGGHLYRYRVVNGIYMGYRPSPTKLSAYHDEFPDSVASVSEDKAQLPDLSDASLALLAKVAADDSYWVDDVRRMYNPTRNTACPLFVPAEDKDDD